MESLHSEHPVAALIKGGVLILVLVLYISLCHWDQPHNNVLIKRKSRHFTDVLIGVPL